MSNINQNQFRESQPVYTQPKLVLPQEFIDYQKARQENPLLARGIESQDPL